MSRAERITVENARRILDVAQGCDAAALRTAFNRKVKTAHPDQGGSEESLRGVLEAYRVLQAWLGVADEEQAEAADQAERLPRLEIGIGVAMNGGRATTRLPDGRRVALTLPAGMRHGERISAAGATLSIAIKSRPEAFVSGDDICLTVRTSQALIRDGGRLKLKTPSGTRLVWVPKQVGTNRIVRILGHGLPARGRHAQGCLILKLVPGKPGKDTAAGSKLKRFGSDWAAA